VSCEISRILDLGVGLVRERRHSLSRWYTTCSAAAVEVGLRRVGRLLSLLAVAGSLPVRGTLAIEGEPAPQERWFGRIATLAAIYHSSATIATPAGVLPGATVTLDNNVTVGFDLGYHIKKSLTATLALGIPPKPTITGEGAVTALGALGRVRYGPAIVTLCYHARLWKGFGVYGGPGTGYAIILKNHDAAVSQLDVHNNWGFVLQAGAEHRVSGQWDLFADFKYVWLDIDADGLLAGGVPITARVRLDPVLVSAGFKFRFR
jgi:outer membrane protein